MKGCGNERHILLFYTGVARILGSAAAQVRAIPNHKADLFDALPRRRGDAVLRNGDLADFAAAARELANKTSAIRPDCTDLSTTFTPARGARCDRRQAPGCGRPAALSVCRPPEDHVKVLSELHELLLVSMQFDWSGAELIFKSVPRYSQPAHIRRDYTRNIVGEDGDTRPEYRPTIIAQQTIEQQHRPMEKRVVN